MSIYIQYIDLWFQIRGYIWLNTVQFKIIQLSFLIKIIVDYGQSKLINELAASIQTTVLNAGPVLYLAMPSHMTCLV